MQYITIFAHSLSEKDKGTERETPPQTDNQKGRKNTSVMANVIVYSTINMYALFKL